MLPSCTGPAHSQLGTAQHKVLRHRVSLHADAVFTLFLRLRESLQAVLLLFKRFDSADFGNNPFVWDIYIKDIAGSYTNVIGN